MRAENVDPVSRPAVQGVGAAPAGLTAAAWGGMQTVVERDRYGLRRDGDAYVAVNHRHRFQVTFGPGGVDVRPRAGAGEWRWGLRLTGYGYGSSPERLTVPTRAVDGNRIEYRRGALVEWYVNERRGVEQGFTLAKPPAGRRAGMPLVVHLTAAGTLRPKLGADGRGVEWRDARGTRTLWYRGLVVVDAEKRTLPSRMEVEGTRLRLRVEDDNAAYPLTIDPFIQIAKLTASDASAGHTFGRSVAISGDTAVVGATFSNSSRGAAYIFERHKGGVDAWGQVARLTASDAAFPHQFGQSVAISGDTVIVGALGHTRGNLKNAGAAYIFDRHHGGLNAWGEVVRLTASDAAADDAFGHSVSISANTALIGAGGNDDAGSNSGSAYIFERHHSGVNAWGEIAKVTASDAAPGDNFGFVAISGDTAVVGAPSASGQSGAAYVLRRSEGGANAWGEVGKLTAGDPAAGDVFGLSVGISGDTIVVGAERDDDAGASSGSAYVFGAGGDDTPPELALPNEVVEEATSSEGAVVAYIASADDVGGDGPLTPECNPPSGSTFPLGTTTVTCTATDSAGNTSTGEFPVTVQDTTPPVLTLPVSPVVDATSAAGAVVSYIASAIDVVDGAVTPVCAPASGTTFPLGTTMVTCTATDGAGNAAAGSFTVTVNDVTTPGRMHGNGFIRRDAMRYQFTFDVRERAAGGERGRLMLQVSEEGTRRPKDDDDDSDQGGRRGRRADRFVSRMVTFVAFSDDPTYRPGKPAMPQVDTVLFSGFGWWNGVDGYWFEAFSSDQGEPGRHREGVRISIRDPAGTLVAFVDGPLDGGNVQSTRIKH